jgi:hypothetical protein
MSMTITQVRPTNAEEWDTIWQHCDYATYYHSRAWADLWYHYTCGTMRPAPRLLTFSDGKTALLPITRQQKYGGFYTSYLSTPAGTFGGWISTDTLHTTHAALLADYMLHRLPNMRWRVNPYNRVVQDIALPITQQDVTHTLPLTSDFGTIYKRWSKGHSSAARKARREGVTISKADTLDDWRAYYAAYTDSLRRWGERATSCYQWTLFETLAHCPSSYHTLWLARFQDTIVAGALCFYARRHVSYWHGAALEAYFHLRPVHLLMYEVIQDACEHGYTWFDFNPSGGNEGVQNFKKGFGADALPCPIVCTSAPEVRVAEAVIRKLRRR